MEKKVILFSAILALAQVAVADTVNLKNVQIKCVPDSGDETVFVGNDTEPSDMNSQLVVYKQKDIVEQSNQKLEFEKISLRRGSLKVSSAGTKVQVDVYQNPFSWNEGSINGQSAKCIIDPAFFQSLKW